MYRIHARETTVSTNLDARAGRHGDVYTAEFQTAGRGRLDHRWDSAAGANLMFSAVFDVAGVPANEVATFPLVVGLALVRTLPAPDLRIKWPNDILAAGRKLAGILCERNGDAVIAGVGVNVNATSFPEALAARATSLALLTGRPHDRAPLLEALLAALYELHARWRRDGFAALWPAFAPYDLLAGKRVRVRQTDADETPLEGLCEGIRRDGTLRVAGTDVWAGEAHVLHVHFPPCTTGGDVLSLTP